MRLRPPRPDERDRLRAIHGDAYTPLVLLAYGSFDEATRRRAFEGDYEHATSRVIESGGEAVGWLRVVPEPGGSFLDTIVIDPAHQGRGLGGEATRICMAQARDAGAALSLSVLQVNRARALYERLGCVVYGEDSARVYMVYDPHRVMGFAERRLRRLIVRGRRHALTAGGQRLEGALTWGDGPRLDGRPIDPASVEAMAYYDGKAARWETLGAGVSSTSI